MRFILSRTGAADGVSLSFDGGHLDGRTCINLKGRRPRGSILPSAGKTWKPLTFTDHDIGIRPYDVFLFYGMFLQFQWTDGRYVQTGLPFHAIWGFMQVEKAYRLRMDKVLHPFEEGMLYVGRNHLECDGYVRSHGYGALNRIVRLSTGDTLNEWKKMPFMDGMDGMQSLGKLMLVDESEQDFVSSHIERMPLKHHDWCVEWMLEQASGLVRSDI